MHLLFKRPRSLPHIEILMSKAVLISCVNLLHGLKPSPRENTSHAVSYTFTWERCFMPQQAPIKFFTSHEIQITVFRVPLTEHFTLQHWKPTKAWNGFTATHAAKNRKLSFQCKGLLIGQPHTARQGRPVPAPACENKKLQACGALLGAAQHTWAHSWPAAVSWLQTHL